MNMNFNRKYKIASVLIIAGIGFAFVGCEDKINPTLQSATPILVVDAWINNMPETQTIVLTTTQPYLDNVLPVGVSGATITISDNLGKVYQFNEDDKTVGNYVWKPTGNIAFGKIGASYKLSVKLKGETFEAVSKMNRTTRIDSITFDSDKEIGDAKSRTRGEFWATDNKGAGDCYWIKAFKNSVLLNKPSEINFAYDGGFSPGGGDYQDSVVFIPPIRRGINSRDKDEASGATGNLSPFVDGDSIDVQIHSITYASFNYLNELVIQTERPGGFAELFSKPLANVSTNIKNANPNGSKAIGFFNVAAVSRLGKRYKKK